MTVDERVFKVFQKTMSADCRCEDWREAESLQSLSAMDSVGILDFVLALEQEFGLKFPIDDLQMELFMDRPRLVSYVADKLSELTC
ncbi:MAG: acyl carrier protein [Planctomycetota bacterium]|nr:acyl carrier protein [Planctomycetota bacterium]